MDITLTVPISALRRSVRTNFAAFFFLFLFLFPPVTFRRVQPVTLLILSSLRKRAKLGANTLATLSCRGPEEDFRLPVEVNIRYSLLKSIVT